MSDIGLTGVSTTSLNKVGPNGEVLPGSAFPGLDAFGGIGPKVGINQAGQNIRSLNFSDLTGQVRTASRTLEEFIDGIFSRVGRSADLKYPLETDNPAYQARVQFQMFSLQPKVDGESQKMFDKVATDNLKSLLESSAKTQDVKAQVDSFGEISSPEADEDFGEGGYADYSGINKPSSSAASATGTTDSSSFTKG